MSDNEFDTQNDIDYIAIENEFMKKNYATNCKTLFDTIYSLVKTQNSNYAKFAIAQVKFSTGETKQSPSDHLAEIAQEMINQSNARIQKNKIAIEKAAKMNKILPIAEFIAFDDLQVVLHNYGINSVGVYVQNNKDMVNWIMQKYANCTISLDMENDKFVAFTISGFSGNAMSLSDDVHKNAFAYYINIGAIVKDDEEELIFGDDLIE